MPNQGARATLVVVVPPGFTTSDELLRYLSQELSFPAYFGGNWDALFDCLCDFNWLEKPTRVVIRHLEVPALSDRERVEYSRVLADAVGSWAANSGRHTLEVHFPDRPLPPQRS